MVIFEIPQALYPEMTYQLLRGFFIMRLSLVHLLAMLHLITLELIMVFSLEMLHLITQATMLELLTEMPNSPMRLEVLLLFQIMDNGGAQALFHEI